MALMTDWSICEFWSISDTNGWIFSVANLATEENKESILSFTKSKKSTENSFQELQRFFDPLEHNHASYKSISN